MGQRDYLLYGFIGAIVIILGLFGATYVAFSENESLKADVRSAEEKQDEAETANRDLAGQVSLLQALAAGDANKKEVGSDDSKITAFRDKNLQVAASAIRGALADLGRTDDVEFTSLVEPYPMIAEIFQGYQQLRDEANARATAAQEALAATIREKDATISQLSDDVAGVRDELGNASTMLDEANQLRDQEKTESGRRIQALQDEMTDNEVLAKRALASAENQIQTLKNRLARFEAEQRRGEQFAELEPDARLFRVAPSLEKGWVDIGRKDHLMKGTLFRVFQIVKGGRKIPKGQVEIRKVGDDSSEVSIVEELDPVRNPITDGDYIASPFYDKSEKPVFVLAGTELQSKSITVEFLRAKLASNGVDLRREVDLNTTYLVALDGYDSTPEYRVAQSLRVPVLRERDVLEFIGY